MDVIPLLLPLFVVPGVGALTSVDVMTDGEVTYVDSIAGLGRAVEDGDIATIHFVLDMEGGKELANTSTRGLPYSLQIQGTESDSPLVEALQGMRVGGERTMVFPSGRMPFPDDPMFLKDGQLVLDIRLLAVRKVPSPPSR
jgi:FKBP-type peptidyl-prolyl cis-trans isomerase